MEYTKLFSHVLFICFRFASLLPCFVYVWICFVSLFLRLYGLYQKIVDNRFLCMFLLVRFFYKKFGIFDFETDKCLWNNREGFRVTICRFSM